MTPYNTLKLGQHKCSNSTDRTYLNYKKSGKLGSTAGGPVVPTKNKGKGIPALTKDYLWRERIKEWDNRLDTEL